MGTPPAPRDAMPRCSRSCSRSGPPAAPRSAVHTYSTVCGGSRAGALLGVRIALVAQRGLSPVPARSSVMDLSDQLLIVASDVCEC